MFCVARGGQNKVPLGLFITCLVILVFKLLRVNKQRAHTYCMKNPAQYEQTVRYGRG